MAEDMTEVVAAEETVAAAAAITGSALRNAVSLSTTDRPTDRPPYNQAAAAAAASAFWQCRRATGHAARLAGTQPVHRRLAHTHDDACRWTAGGDGCVCVFVWVSVCVRVRLCEGGEGLAGPEEIPIQFLHKANDSPPRSRGTPPPPAVRRPVAAQFIFIVILFILLLFRFYFFFFFNWNHHHPLAGVTKRRVLETHLSQTIDQGH